jgi:hypothetical protein
MNTVGLYTERRAGCSGCIAIDADVFLVPVNVKIIVKFVAKMLRIFAYYPKVQKSLIERS